MILDKGHIMDRAGLSGFIMTWATYALSLFQAEENLRIVALYLAIAVSIATLLWYAGKMIIEWKNMKKAIKEMFK